MVRFTIFFSAVSLLGDYLDYCPFFSNSRKRELGDSFPNIVVSNARVEPHPGLERSDAQDLRKRILELTQREAEELGIGKSTLHHLRRNALRGRPLKVYQKVAEKLQDQRRHDTT